jgi:integrating conjugative element protein, PFL_4695 family
MKTISIIISFILAAIALPAFADQVTNPNAHKLIVVEDIGGVSALPYFEEIGLSAEKPVFTTPLRQVITEPVSIAVMLPVRSELLTPGTVTARAIQAAGLRPMFIIGDDELSRQWLVYRRDALVQLNAVGLVVNVENEQRLQALQVLVPELPLSPVSGDDIAHRLNLQHYPVLITSTSIEQ